MPDEFKSSCYIAAAYSNVVDDPLCQTELNQATTCSYVVDDRLCQTI